MQDSTKKSRKDKIKQNKPKRQQQSQQDKEFLNDLKLLIRLREERQMVQDVIDKLKERIQIKQMQLQEKQEMKQDIKSLNNIAMLLVVLKQKGIEVQGLQSSNQIRTPWKITYNLLNNFYRRDESFMLECETDKYISIPNPQMIKQRLRNVLQCTKDQCQDDSDQQNTNQVL